MKERLETDRLILRPWVESDAEALYRYAKNPNVGPIAGWPPHASIEDSRAIIQHVLSWTGNYAVVLKETMEPIGSFGIMTPETGATVEGLTDREYEFGYWIGEPYWGRGFMPEVITEALCYAFEELKAEAIWCGYYDGNAKSQRAQQKCGFRHQYTRQGVSVPLLREIRTIHVTCITQGEWRESEEAKKKE